MKKAALCAALLLGTSGFVAMPGSAGAVTWPAPVNVSEVGKNVEEPKVVTGPDGTVTAVYRQSDGISLQIMAQSRPQAGAWSSPAQLSAPGQNSDMTRLAIAPDGTVTAVWLRFDGANFRVQASTRALSGTWSAATTLSAAGQSAGDPQLATGPDGTVTAVWSRSDGSFNRVETSTRTPSGVWSEWERISDPGQTAAAQTVTIGGNGRATVVFYRNDGANFRIQVTSRPAGGAWTAPLNLSEGGAQAFEPTVAEGPGGATTVLWVRNDGGFRVQASTLTPNGWTQPATLSPPGQQADRPRVVIGPDGTATAVWRLNDPTPRIYTSTRPATGLWSPSEPLSAANGLAADQEVVLAPDGTTLVAWQRDDGADYRSQVTTRPPGGGAWTVPVDLSATGESTAGTRLAVGVDGTAAIVWRRSDGASTRLQAVVVDKAFAPPVVVPDTSAISGKKKITKAKASYKFSSPTPGAAFECRVDKKFKKYAGVSKKKAKKQVPWKACTSPYVVKAKKLQNGKHKLYVRAVLKGVVDPTPSAKKVKVQR